LCIVSQIDFQSFVAPLSEIENLSEEKFGCAKILNNIPITCQQNLLQNDFLSMFQIGKTMKSEHGESFG
jgi:hypothetical protein